MKNVYNRSERIVLATAIIYIIMDIRMILSSSLEHYTFPIQLLEILDSKLKNESFQKCFYWGLDLWVTSSFRWISILIGFSIYSLKDPLKQSLNWFLDED